MKKEKMDMHKIYRHETFIDGELTYTTDVPASAVIAYILNEADVSKIVVSCGHKSYEFTPFPVRHNKIVIDNVKYNLVPE